MNNQCLSSWIVGSLTLAVLTSTYSVQAQIIPDATLPVNSSVVPGCTVCTITSGTERGVNLYHSFREFSIPTGGEAFFNNAPQIQNILTRVTGTSLSNIDGLVRANGTANLFLLNPNGIAFGPNARLQIGGSFLASTGSSFQFADGSEFSATNPQAPPLLTLNIVPGVQTGLPPASSTLTNRGNLTAGQNLTLVAGNLDLQGQLQAGGNLTLNATDTVKIRDTVTESFLARSAGNITIQGNQGVDVLVLNHLATTPFVNGGNFSLISDGVISGDAHYQTGGSFSILNTAGNPGSFSSNYDPIIRAAGNVTFGNYSGVSLEVNAGGSITTGTITITGSDPAVVDPTGLGNPLVLTLNAGVTGAINNQTFPTNSGGTTFTTIAPATTPAGITVGNISANPSQAFSVTLTAPGTINTQGIVTPSNTSRYSQITVNSTAGSVNLNGNLSVSNSSPGSFAGNIFINAAQSVAISNSQLTATGNEGWIFIGPSAFTPPTFTAIPSQITLTNSTLSADNLQNGSGSGLGGLIGLTAGTIVMQNSSLTAPSSGSASGGSITLTATSAPTPTSPTSIRLSQSTINASTSSSNNTVGGVTLAAPQGNIILDTNSQITTSTTGISAASPISIVAAGNLQVSDRTVINAGTQSTSSGGSINVTVNRLEALNGGQLTTAASSSGDAGNITVTALGGITLSDVAPSLPTPTSPFAGVSVRELMFADFSTTNNPNIEASTTIPHTNQTLNGDGTFLYFGFTVATAGSVGIFDIDNGSLPNGFDTQLFLFDRGTGALLASNDDSPTFLGAGGSTSGLDSYINYTFQAPGNYVIGVGRFPSSASSGSLISGSAPRPGQSFTLPISLSAPGINTFSTTNQDQTNRSVTSGLVAASTGGGNAGSILVNTGQLNVQVGAIISTTSTTGSSGDITIQGVGAVPLNTLQVNNGSISATTESGESGNILINGGGTAQVSLQAGAQISTSNTSSTVENAGNITLQGLSTLQVTNSQIASTTRSGIAGNVTVNATRQVNLDGNAGGFVNNNGSSQGGITAAASQGGNAGTVNIEVPTLTIANGASVAASSTGAGTAGDVTVNATSAVTLNNGAISATTESGRSGNIVVNGSGNTQVSLQAGSQISASSTSSTAGDAGNITLQGLNTLQVTNSQIASTTQTGIAGNVTVTADGRVDLNGTYNVAVPDSITAAATRGGNAGSVSITSPTLAIANGASVAASSTGAGTAGDVTVNATRAVTLNNGTISATTELGRSGNILVNGSGNTQVSLQSGSQISASNTSSTAANAGNITLQGLDTLQVTNSQIASTTQTGNAGNVTVNAAGPVNLDGTYNGIVPGSITAAATQGGNAGSVNITSSTLDLDNGASVAVSSSNGSGTAGNIDITARSITLNNAAQISAETDAGGAGRESNIILQGLRTLTVNNSLISSATNTGTAGNVTVQASGQVLLNGTSNALRDSQGQPLRDRDGTPRTLGGIVAEARQTNGTAGSITITSGQFTVQNGARVSVSSPDGQAGSLAVNATGILLNRGTLEAIAGAGDNANINLQIAPGGFLFMANGSLISANALDQANGGNITITVPRGFLFSGVLQNDDITANSFNGNGGNVTISAASVLGFTRRSRAELIQLGQLDPRLLPTNDITAFSLSSSNRSGTVFINTLIDPGQGLEQPNLIPIDPSKRVAEGCNSGRRAVEGQNKFVILGRGGLAASPDDPLGSASILPDLGSTSTSSPAHATGIVPVPTADSSPTTIIEAQSWVQGADGRIYLVNPSVNVTNATANSTATPTINATANSQGLPPVPFLSLQCQDVQSTQNF